MAVMGEVDVRDLDLIPSECRLALGGGMAGGFPLWEDFAPSRGLERGQSLIYCRTGVEGDRPPAGPASGRVDCRWREPSEERLSLGSRGVPRDGSLKCRGLNPTERQLVVWAPDGLLEVRKVTCFERIELDGC